ncbi:MAG: glycine--tRNA ligase [Candidatus Yanofskybacteria bacterium]|nr:glycine--tRNA ligase [Candidatus Yanofskybacteria bacterium]
MEQSNNLLEKIVSLCKRRGFIFPGSEIYGGLANSWDYGPLGVELKNNIKQFWWKKFVHQRDDMVGIDAAVIMNSKVWEASGHVTGFSDPLVECKKCHQRFREDDLIALYLSKLSKQDGPISTTTGQVKGKYTCPNCGNKEFSEPKQFNLLFPVRLGATEDSSAIAYLRGEIAQAMFVDFKNVLDSSRVRVPFGIASQGKAFRNEITPGNFIFRTREFDLMEFEYFIKPEEWEKWFDYWRQQMLQWLEDIGADMSKVYEHDIPDGERAHYSKRTIDFEFDYPFGRKELYGLAYRTDFDLKNHFKEPPYKDPETGELYWPHVIEPSFGLDRSFLIVLLSAYKEEDDRVVLKLPLKLAPYKAAVFPLLKNKPELVAKAKEIYDSLRQEFPVDWDDRGNIGKRYYAQDEIGTPYCITVDFQTLEDNTVTLRDRDTMEQKRVTVSSLTSHIKTV